MVPEATTEGASVCWTTRARLPIAWQVAASARTTLPHIAQPRSKLLRRSPWQSVKIRTIPTTRAVGTVAPCSPPAPMLRSDPRSANRANHAGHGRPTQREPFDGGTMRSWRLAGGRRAEANRRGPVAGDHAPQIPASGFRGEHGEHGEHERPPRGRSAMLRTKHRRVARANHAKHATHEEPGGPVRRKTAIGLGPVVCTKHRRVARARHATHATPGRPMCRSWRVGAVATIGRVRRTEATAPATQTPFEADDWASAGFWILRGRATTTVARSGAWRSRHGLSQRTLSGRLADESHRSPLVGVITSLEYSG
jgi:hypothetical protein